MHTRIHLQPSRYSLTRLIYYFLLAEIFARKKSSLFIRTIERKNIFFYQVHYRVSGKKPLLIEFLVGITLLIQLKGYFLYGHPVVRG